MEADKGQSAEVGTLDLDPFAPWCRAAVTQHEIIATADTAEGRTPTPLSLCWFVSPLALKAFASQPFLQCCLEAPLGCSCASSATSLEIPTCLANALGVLFGRSKNARQRGSASAAGRRPRGAVRQDPQTLAQKRAILEQAFDIGMDALPNRQRTREQDFARPRQCQPTTSPVGGIDSDTDQSAPEQRLEQCRQCRAIHAKQRCRRAEARRLGAVERHQQRELAIRQAQWAESVIKAPRQSTCRTLGVKTQAVLLDVTCRCRRRRAEL